MKLMCLSLCGVLTALGSALPSVSAAESQSKPPALGLTKGLCVVVGEGACARAIKLARETELLVYVQLPDAKSVRQGREQVLQAAGGLPDGFLNQRIWVEQGPPAHLGLADNLADALWAGGGSADVPEAEALRVLRPLGTARFGGRVITKPVPAGVDDWSHPYHLPDNNPASCDQVARGPYLTQFLAEPHYAPLPQVAVASGGRIFKAFGHIAFKEREEGWLNTLAAFSGYNGTLLWRREIAPALMVHRSTLIATPTNLYFGDDQCCHVFDAETGEERDKIAPPAEVAGGTFWKWMALEKGVLYALIGDQEQRDPVIKARMNGHGWPWDPLSPGFNRSENNWGYGQTLLAIDPVTKEVLWRYHEDQAMDSRALCLKDGRLYAFSFDHYLTCLDAQTGSHLWRQTKETAPELFTAIGPYSKRQDWRTNWRTTAYLKCSEKALYFAGPTIEKLIAVSAEDGHVLWQHPYNNYQLILQNNTLYGISGQIDKEVSRTFDPLSGRVLSEIEVGRRACTRPTAAADAIFFRAGEGSTRIDLAKGKTELVSPMRPNCHDGVTVANGLLYWWPSVCDCNLTLYGITCLGPAGDFNFAQRVAASERLENGTAPAETKLDPGLAASRADWPVFRANNQGTVTSDALLPTVEPKLQMPANPPVASVDRIKTGRRDLAPAIPTAPTAVVTRVFWSGAVGVVESRDLAKPAANWRALVGGSVRYPPTVWNGRAYVGCDDGWMYCLNAADGSLRWRFRAAPVERHIPVYGRLMSTWPVASGVLIEDGVAYFAAGIINVDGTHVYALDAVTGQLKWQNNTSGHLDRQTQTGVSVQGQLLIQGGRLFLAGGNAVSPAMYDLETGQCLNDVKPLRQTQNNHVVGSYAPRGCELYALGNAVMVSGKPFYAHPKWPVYAGEVISKTLVASVGDRDILWVNNFRLIGLPRLTEDRDQRLQRLWGKPALDGLKPAWEQTLKDSLALAVCRNAVVIASATEVVVFNLEDGRELWRRRLPASPVAWGLALDRAGRIILTLENGAMVWFEAPAEEGPGRPAGATG